jgi:hypothetical protein
MFNVLASGFFWTDSATYAAVGCALVLVLAAVLFFRFGKVPSQPNDAGQPIWKYFAQFDVAVTGALARGNKAVDAHEFIATLMSLERRGFLEMVEGPGAEADLGTDAESATEIIGLAMSKMGAKAHATAEAPALVEAPATAKVQVSAIDQKSLDLLRMFAEEDGTVYLGSAKQRGEQNADAVKTAYAQWKELVATTAEASMLVKAPAWRAQKALLYGGYVLVILAALSSYFLTLMTSLVFLLTGAALIALSMRMRHVISVEKNAARELARWLTALETRRADVPTDREGVQRLLEYAVVFGIAENTGYALRETQTAVDIDKEIAHLAFWKQLRSALYTSN